MSRRPFAKLLWTLVIITVIVNGRIPTVHTPVFRLLRGSIWKFITSRRRQVAPRTVQFDVKVSTVTIGRSTHPRQISCHQCSGGVWDHKKTVNAMKFKNINDLPGRIACAIPANFQDLWAVPWWIQALRLAGFAQGIQKLWLLNLEDAFIQIFSALSCGEHVYQINQIKSNLFAISSVHNITIHEYALRLAGQTGDNFALISAHDN